MGLWNERWVKNLHVHLPLGGKSQAMQLQTEIAHKKNQVS